MSLRDEDRIERPIRTSDLRRNPDRSWAGRGALVGGVFGTGLGVATVLSGAVGFNNIVGFVIVFGFLGAGVGMVVAVLCLTFRPVLLALFASPKTFRDEYGTPEEQGRIRDSAGERIAPLLPPTPGGQQSPGPPRDRQEHLQRRSDLTRPAEEG